MTSDLTVQERRKIFLETGSPLDATNTSRIKTRPGVHPREIKAVDVSAFSFSKHTEKVSPEKFVKKHTGTGGTIVCKQIHMHTLFACNFIFL
jgi:hypothetical protein